MIDPGSAMTVEIKFKKNNLIGMFQASVVAKLIKIVIFPSPENRTIRLFPKVLVT
jgi:hypothetical protein